jgi:hypothetical protein
LTIAYTNLIHVEEDVLTMHRMFYESIEKEHAGKYRDMDVFISGSKCPVT